MHTQESGKGMKKLRNNKIRKLLAFMVALALMVSCMPSAYTISASEAFGDGTEDIFTDGEITSEPAAEESTPDVSSADQEETEQAQQSTLTYENDSVKVTAEALEDGALPQNTALKADGVNENSSVSYDTVSQKLSVAATDKGSSLRGFFAYDVYFADGDGNRVEPNGRVRVTFEYKTPAAPELTDAASTSVTVEKLHYNSSTGDTDVNTLQANEDLKVLNVNEGKQIQTLQVETGNAAVFAVMWDSPETADVEAGAVSGNEDEVPIASEELTDGMDISDEPEQDAAETPAAENPEVTETPAAEPEVTETPVEEPEVTEIPAEEPEITETPAMMIEVIADDVNIRVSPSTEAESLMKVEMGMQFTVLETVTAEDGTTWYKVSYEGTEGYIRSDLVKVVEDVNESEEDENSFEEIQEEEAVTYTKEVDNVVITATAAQGVLPEDAELVVNEIGKENSQYSEVENQLNEKAAGEDYTVAGFLAYDIYFQDGEGNKLEPEEGTVKVSMKYKEAAVPEEVKENAGISMLSIDGAEATNTDSQEFSIAVMHLLEDENGNIQSVVDMTAEGNADVETNSESQIQKAEFVTESFSVFTITWKNSSNKLAVHLIDTSGKGIGNETTENLGNNNAVTAKSIAPSVDGYSFYKAKVASKATDAGTVIKRLRYEKDEESNQYNTADKDGTWQDIGNKTVYFVYVKNLETVETVNHTGDGIIMRMKNLYGNNVSIGPTSDPNSWINIGGSYGDGSIKKNLLNKVLASNGYPDATNNSGNLEKLVNGDQVNKLFLESVYEQTGYYEYSSFNNYAYLGNNSEFKVYDAIGTPVDGDAYYYQRGNFMPYNDIEDGNFSSKTNSYSEDGEKLKDSDPAKGKVLYKTKGNNDFYFGMSMEANFLQPKEGKVTSPNSSTKENMIYEFNGDDDMWIYIDNVLMLDIGGVHDAHSGKINFNTGVISWKDCTTGNTPKESTRTIKEMFREAGKFPDGTEWDDSKVDNYFKKDTLKDFTMHSFKMFYMERGAGASNLHVKFNIQVIPKGQVEVRKELSNTDKEKYSNVKFAFQLYAQKKTGTDAKGNEIYAETGSDDDYELLGSGSAVYGNGGKPTSNAITFSDAEINETSYKNVFYLKPDESAIFTGIQANRKYYVQEIGVKSEEYSQIIINDTGYTEYDENNQAGDGKIKSAKTDKKTVSARPVVVYTNNCSGANSRELQITKEMNPDQETTDTFSFKIQLGPDKDDLQDYSGKYYVKKDGFYYRFNDQNQLEIINDSSDDSRDLSCGSTDNGIVSGIPKGYTVILTQIMSGTYFKVTEVNLDSNKYESPKYETVNKNDVGKADGEAAETNEGTIKLNYNAAVTVTNTPYSKIKVDKIWQNGTTQVEGTASVYVGLYQKNVNEDGETLTPIAGKYAELNSQNQYSATFDKLDSRAEYVVKELRLATEGETADFTIKVNGTDTGYVKVDSTVRIGNIDYEVSYSDLVNDASDPLQKNITITNRKNDKITVIKNWTDGAENHADDTVIAGLYKNDQYADQYKDLNSSNSWTGEFTVDELNGYSVKELQSDNNGTVTIDGKKYSPVAENSVIVIADKKYKVTYSDSTEDQVKTVTLTNNRLGSITITKVDSKDNSKLLKDAEFKLQKKDEQNNEFNDVPNGTVRTDDRGKAVFDNLEPGTYKIIETKAPKRYILSADEITVDIGIGEHKTFEVTQQINNTQIYELPSAGGPGIYGFTISGVAILATALLLFINNKRREEEAEKS